MSFLYLRFRLGTKEISYNFRLCSHCETRRLLKFDPQRIIGLSWQFRVFLLFMSSMKIITIRVFLIYDIKWPFVFKCLWVSESCVTYLSWLVPIEVHNQILQLLEALIRYSLQVEIENFFESTLNNRYGFDEWKATDKCCSATQSERKQTESVNHILLYFPVKQSLQPLSFVIKVLRHHVLSCNVLFFFDRKRF